MRGKLWPAWSRADDRVLELALGLALLLVGVAGVLLPVLSVAGLWWVVDTREVRLDEPAQLSAAVSSDGMTLRGTDTAELVFAQPDFAERLLLVLPQTAGALILLVILELLRRMARSLRDGDVFIARNTRRLAVMAGAVVVFGTLPPLVDTVTTEALVSGTQVGAEVPMAYEFSAWYLLLAMLLAAAAEAFAQGGRLRADTEGLI